MQHLMGLQATLRAFSWLMVQWVGPAHCWWGHPWPGSPGFYRKADWTNCGEQAVLLPQDLVLVPALTAFNDELEYGNMREINSPPGSFWSWRLVTIVLTLTKSLPRPCLQFIPNWESPWSVPQSIEIQDKSLKGATPFLCLWLCPPFHFWSY